MPSPRSSPQASHRPIWTSSSRAPCSTTSEGRWTIPSCIAYLGAQIAEKKGLPKCLVEIIRKHTGAGLDDQDVKEMGLPPGDYMPKTLEEKIVAHADNMVSDNRVVPHRHSVDKLMFKGAERGALRVEMLHKELSDLYGCDLDTIIDEIGEYPKLKHVKP